MKDDVEWRPRAIKDLRRADRTTHARIIEAIEKLAGTGVGDVRRLSGTDLPEYRLRVGEWRVRFQKGHQKIVILRVLPRGNAYSA
jgi:mRNA interferase RelE/StbE